MFQKKNMPLLTEVYSENLEVKGKHTPVTLIYNIIKSIRGGVRGNVYKRAKCFCNSSYIPWV
jgi:hypothetical protein